MRSVVVIGGGIAGTAAALAAARAGASVTLVDGGTGASVLAGGAKDERDWEDEPPEAPDATLAPLDERARAVVDALGGTRVTDRRALVVVTTGLVRPARGVDAALLDLASLPGGAVLVPDVEHGAWDARSLARTWSASERTKDRGLRFVAGHAKLLAHTEERSFADAELAARHDDDARLAWLAERLREARTALARELVAIVLPPWLGVARERATALSALMGVPCGEALGGVGGPAGLRFEHSRDRAFAAAGVVVLAGRASLVTRHADDDDHPWHVHVAKGRLDCDAVVLATGGILGGGLEYTPAGAYLANALPDTPRPLVRVTLDAPVRLGAFGRALAEPSSLFGGAPETHAWPYVREPLLDHAGVMVHDAGEVKGAAPGLYATGEVAAGPAHTWLAALTHGARAGDAAGRA